MRRTAPLPSPGGRIVVLCASRSAGGFRPSVRAAVVAAIGLLASLGHFATAADAQAVRPINPGAPVRIWTHGADGAQPLVGSAVGQDASTLRVLTRDSLLALSLTTIDSLQVRRTLRKSQAAKYAVAGALIGGTVCGLAAYSSAERDGWENLVGALGAAAGLAGGALVGGFVGGTKRQVGWTTVLPPIRLAASGHAPADWPLQVRVSVAVR